RATAPASANTIAQHPNPAPAIWAPRTPGVRQAISTMASISGVLQRYAPGWQCNWACATRVVPIELVDELAQRDRGIRKEVEPHVANLDAVVGTGGGHQDRFLIDRHEIAVTTLPVDVPAHDVDPAGRADQDRTPITAEDLAETEQGPSVSPSALDQEAAVIAVVRAQDFVGNRDRLIVVREE